MEFTAKYGHLGHHAHHVGNGINQVGVKTSIGFDTFSWHVFFSFFDNCILNSFINAQLTILKMQFPVLAWALWNLTFTIVPSSSSSSILNILSLHSAIPIFHELHHRVLDHLWMKKCHVWFIQTKLGFCHGATWSASNYLNHGPWGIWLWIWN